MTVAAVSPINSYVGNGGASSFAFTFPVFLSSQLLATIVYTSTGATTTLVLGTDYNVTGLNASGDPASTGTIALINSSQAWLSAGNLATGYTLVVQSNFALAQTTSIRNQGDFYRSALENAIDTLEYQIQQIELQIGSQLTLPTGILPSAFSPILPSGLASSAGLAIVVNSTGTGFALGAGSSVTLPVSVAQGGTGSSTVLAGNRLMKSSGQTIVELAALTANRILSADTNGLPTTAPAATIQAAKPIKFVTTTDGIVGTTTNDNASAGNVGEYIESVVATIAGGASGVFSDLTSIALTAGDWDVTGAIYFSGGTGYTVWQIGISLTSGNSTTGLVLGSNRFVTDLTGGVSVEQNLYVPVYRISLSGASTPVYLKFAQNYTGGTPVGSGRISARRIR